MCWQPKGGVILIMCSGYIVWQVLFCPHYIINQARQMGTVDKTGRWRRDRWKGEGTRILSNKWHIINFWTPIIDEIQQREHDNNKRISHLLQSTLMGSFNTPTYKTPKCHCYLYPLVDILRNTRKPIVYFTVMSYCINTHKIIIGIYKLRRICLCRLNINFSQNLKYS